MTNTITTQTTLNPTKTHIKMTDTMMTGKPSNEEGLHAAEMNPGRENS
jgi:hypothetical protein